MEANGSPSHISTKIQLFILDYLDRAQSSTLIRPAVVSDWKRPTRRVWRRSTGRRRGRCLVVRRCSPQVGPVRRQMTVDRGQQAVKATLTPTLSPPREREEGERSLPRRACRRWMFRPVLWRYVGMRFAVRIRIRASGTFTSSGRSTSSRWLGSSRTTARLRTGAWCCTG